MADERFRVSDVIELTKPNTICDGDIFLTQKEVCDLLNKQDKELTRLKTEVCPLVHHDNFVTGLNKAQELYINELKQKNEQLKQTIETQRFNYENAKGIIHSSEHQIQDLQDENEELRQHIKYLNLQMTADLNRRLRE